VSGPPGGGANHRVLTALVNGIAVEPGSPDARRAEVISKGSADPQVMLHVLDSLVPTSEAALRGIAVPTLVAIGDQDERSDAGQLATLLRNARFVRVPGDHASAFAAPELTIAILTFLAER
jgi:pimeloyl-ACP methyl ester carboxylesterase